MLISAFKIYVPDDSIVIEINRYLGKYIKSV